MSEEFSYEVFDRLCVCEPREIERFETILGGGGGGE